jgi:Fe-S cluster assembly protein SufD
VVTEAAAQQGFTAAAFDALLASRTEPDWLTELRRSAFKTLSASSLPDRNEEEWMRTDIRLFHPDRFAPLAIGDGVVETSKPGDEIVEPLLSSGVELAGRTAAVDGRTVVSELNPKWAERGVLFGSLGQLVADHGELLRPHLLARAVDPHADYFSALHAAFWTGGTLLYVPRGVVIDEPFHMISSLNDGRVDLGHTLVVLEDGAEATLLAETASADEKAGGLHCGAIELLVGPNASLRYVNLQNWGSGVWHFARQKALVDRDARLQWTIGALGSRLAKVNQHVALVGAGADVQVNGVMFTQGKQHLSYHTLQHHEAPSCHSDLLYKAGLQDHSRTVWRGMIKVDREAQKTDGYQRNDSLILDRNARADSIPGLEIEADDVRCTHGSTAGRVDEEQVFYARSRGYTRQEAIRMIVTGFFQQIFDRITIESVRDALAEAIGRRIRDYE